MTDELQRIIKENSEYWKQVMAEMKRMNTNLEKLQQYAPEYKLGRSMHSDLKPMETAHNRCIIVLELINGNIEQAIRVAEGKG